MKYALIGAIALASVLAGCSAQQAAQAQTDINLAIEAGTVFSCDLSAVSGAALTIEQAVNSGKAIVKTGTTNVIYVASAATCAAFGGVPKPAPASALAQLRSMAR